jgi:hypothetical protein
VADSGRIDDLRRRVQRDPASIAFAQLAEECRRAGQFQESVEICRVGLAIHPGYLSARVTLGRALIEMNQPDEAQAELDLVLKSAPENLAALRGLGEIHEGKGNLSQALVYYRAALTLAKNDPDLQETVHDLSQKVEPQAPHASADGLSLEQMEREMLEQHPPRPPLPVPVVGDAAAPLSVVASGVPAAAPPGSESVAVSQTAAPDAQPPVVSQAAAPDAEPPVVSRAAAPDAELHVTPMPDVIPMPAGDQSDEQPAATLDLGSLEQWVDAEPFVAPSAPVVAHVPTVPEVPPVAALVAEPHIAPGVGVHELAAEPDATAPVTLDPLAPDMIAWLDAAPAGTAEPFAIAGHTPDAPAATLDTLPTDMIAWLDAAPFDIPEVPRPAAIAAHDPDAEAAAVLAPPRTNTIPWLGAAPLVTPAFPRAAALVAAPSDLADDETDIQSGAMLDPLALRTIGALEKWLDAIHVARTHLGA